MFVVIQPLSCSHFDVYRRDVALYCYTLNNEKTTSFLHSYRQILTDDGFIANLLNSMQPAADFFKLVNILLNIDKRIV